MVEAGEVDDVVRDLVEVLTLVCARLYGRRSARNRALQALRCAEHDLGPARVAGGGRWRWGGRLMRRLAAPFVVAPPGGARIRTRLRLPPADERVLRAAGCHLGRLASADLAVRCRLGRGLGRGDLQRTERKRALTAGSSSRWAGALTRTSNDQWERGRRNLLDARAGLRRACRTIRARLAVPVGGRQGRVRGYASQAERYEKQRRLQHLQAQLCEVDQRLASGRVAVCRGGRRLAKLRHAVGQPDAPLSEDGWRARWQAARWFLTADGEAGKRWGNETIRVHPDQHWLEIRLPTPLAPLSNTPGRVPTYRLSCPVTFTYRADQWAAQAATGAVRYDLWWGPAKRSGWPPPTAAAAWSSRTSTLLPPASKAARPWAAAPAASGFAGAWPACRRGSSATSWSAWRPTRGCGWWRSTPPGPPGGRHSTGVSH